MQKYFFDYCLTYLKLMIKYYLYIKFTKFWKHSSAGMSVRLTRERSGVRASLLPLFFWGYSSAGRAIRSQRIGHGFESRYLHEFSFSHPIKGSIMLLFIKTLVYSYKYHQPFTFFPRNGHNYHVYSYYKKSKGGFIHDRNFNESWLHLCSQRERRQ